MQGTIRNIRDDKDFAFIVSGNNRDIFLHRQQFHGDWNKLLEAWRKGEVTVDFELNEGPKGYRAVNCKVVENA